MYAAQHMCLLSPPVTRMILCNETDSGPQLIALLIAAEGLGCNLLL